MTLTQVTIMVTFVLWIAYTVKAHSFGQKTISSTLRDMGWDFSSFAFIWGMLITHWFAPRQELPTQLWGWGIGVPVLAILFGWDIYRLITNAPRQWYRWPMFYVGLGLPFGYIFWPQLSVLAPF